MEKKKNKKNLYNARPVVALNPKGEVIGYYESMRQAASLNGWPYSAIHDAIHHDRYTHGIRWMLEEEYRKYWYEGRTDELRYSKQERASAAMKKVWKNMSPETIELRNRKISKAKKRQGKAGVASAVQARRKKVYCITTGREYASCAEYAADIGGGRSNVAAAIRAGKEVHGMLAVYRN